MASDEGGSTAGRQYASWNPAFRPNSEQTIEAAPTSPLKPTRIVTNTVPESLDESLITTTTKEDDGGDAERDVGQSNDVSILGSMELAQAKAFEHAGQEPENMVLSVDESRELSPENEWVEPTTPPEPSDFPVPEKTIENSWDDGLHSNASMNQSNEFEKSDILEHHSPAETYEFQGGSTALDDAIQEDGAVPLSADVPSAADWGASAESFEIVEGASHSENTLHSQSENLSQELPTQKATYTASNAAQGETRDIDWGSSDVDAFKFDTEIPITTENETSNGLFGSDSSAAQFTTELPAASSAVPPAEKDLDALWQAALGDDALLDDGNTVDPTNFFADDGEGLLEDDESVAPPVLPKDSTNVPLLSSAAKYTPPTAQTTQPGKSSPYAPSGPQFTDLSSAPTHSLSQAAPRNSQPLQAPYAQPYQQDSRPAPPSNARSFVDKSRGGYASPYDLPDDLMPRKRPSMPTIQRSGQAQPIPPRASGPPAFSQSGQPPVPPARSTSILSPPLPNQANQASPAVRTGGNPSSTMTTPKSASGEFFADLPISSKPRQSSHSSRFAPQPAAPLPPANQSLSMPPMMPTPPVPQVQDNRHPLATELRPPERMPLYSDASPIAPNIDPPTQPPLQSRYSPMSAPPVTASGKYSPTPNSGPPLPQKYSPAPGAQASTSRYASIPNKDPVAPPHSHQSTEIGVPPRPPSQTYAPRTSSPLAHHTSIHDLPQTAEWPGQSGASEAASTPFASSIPTQEAFYSTAAPLKTSTPPPPRSGPPSVTSSPRKRSQASYVPLQPTQIQPNVHPITAVSSLPKTHSPSSTMPQAAGVASPGRSFSISDADAPGLAVTQKTPVLPHRRMFSRDLNFITPTDDRSEDPLERWRGRPIFVWALGGTMLTSFPKQTPRYGAGQSIPMIKCGPGELKISNAREMCPLPEKYSKFPGPLRSKSKKKDVITWLKARIDVMDKDHQMAVSNYTLPADDQKKAEERLLLWKVLLLFIENDGVLEGNPTVDEATRALLSPELREIPDTFTPYSAGASSLVGSQQLSQSARSEPVNPGSIEEIRRHLEKGDRENATWLAADNRLWGHAMLISSTLSKDLWKRVVQEFVRREVKGAGGANESMAALYEVFAGSWEESVDELVPVSARAGIQMISKSDSTGSTKDALAGLEQWRSTLLLILSNRSEGDTQAILSLGKLLAGYGRAEAAHICFMFARSSTYFGGVEDPQSNVVLIGADHVHKPLDLGLEMDSILLTEIYEFGLSLFGTTASSTIPHLQAYKLYHAYTLAEYGHQTEAQLYCDAIANSMKSTTRSSSYYHGHLISQLDDLTKRLSQSPKDSSASWISKPTMDKVSVNIWTKFNNFVAGEESDNASNASGTAGADVGPFGKVLGGGHDMSRSNSNADMYGPYAATTPPTASQLAPPTKSRYTPGNPNAKRTSLENSSRSRYDPAAPQSERQSMESNDSTYTQRPNSNHGVEAQSPLAHLDSSAPHNQTMQYAAVQRGRAPRASYSYAPSPLERSQSHQPRLAQSYAPTPPTADHSPSPYAPPSHVPQYPEGDEHIPSRGPSIELSPPPTSSGLPANFYEPPSQSSYEPPSYQPYSADAGGEEETNGTADKSAKKKSFMDLDDEDDEFEKRAAQLKQQQKAQADREASEAVRKAAEADAAKGLPAKKGWFGTWFKKESSPAPGPIRAKLGEENSFVFDADLGRWVNKKGGAEAAQPSAPTPPPPRGGPGRAVSSSASVGNNTPPPGSGPSAPPMMRPPLGVTGNIRSASMPPPMSSAAGAQAGTPPRSESPAPNRAPHPLGAGATGPPSRPPTAMSNASSIDDLLGAPGARKGGTVKKSKKGRGYVNILQQ